MTTGMAEEMGWDDDRDGGRDGMGEGRDGGRDGMGWWQG